MTAARRQARGDQPAPGQPRRLLPRDRRPLRRSAAAAQPLGVRTLRQSCAPTSTAPSPGRSSSSTKPRKCRRPCSPNCACWPPPNWTPHPPHRCLRRRQAARRAPARRGVPAAGQPYPRPPYPGARLAPGPAGVPSACFTRGRSAKPHGCRGDRRALRPRSGQSARPHDHGRRTARRRRPA